MSSTVATTSSTKRSRETMREEDALRTIASQVNAADNAAFLERALALTREFGPNWMQALQQQQDEKGSPSSKEEKI